MKKQMIKVLASGFILFSVLLQLVGLFKSTKLLDKELGAKQAEGQLVASTNGTGGWGGLPKSR